MSNQWDTLQFSTDGRSGHLFSDGHVLDTLQFSTDGRVVDGHAPGTCFPWTWSRHSSVFHGWTVFDRLPVLLQVQPLFRFLTNIKEASGIKTPGIRPRTSPRRNLEYIGRHGFSLSGSYQQGYSTTYNTQSHIKVVCNGYILAHISN